MSQEPLQLCFDFIFVDKLASKLSFIGEATSDHEAVTLNLSHPREECNIVSFEVYIKEAHRENDEYILNQILKNIAHLG